MKVPVMSFISLNLFKIQDPSQRGAGVEEKKKTNTKQNKKNRLPFQYVGLFPV